MEFSIPSISHEWYRILFAGTCRDKTNWETLTSEAFPIVRFLLVRRVRVCARSAKKVTNFECLQEHRNRTRHVQCEVPTRERNPVAYGSCGINIPQVPWVLYSSWLRTRLLRGMSRDKAIVAHGIEKNLTIVECIDVMLSQWGYPIDLHTGDLQDADRA